MSTTYTLLSADLQGWLEDDDAEFEGSIDKVIELGELRLLRDLHLSIFHTVDTAATVSGTATLTKPTTDASVIAFDSLWYGTAPNTVFLELRSHDFVRDYISGTNGPPKYYAELSETEWLLGPVPDAIYTVNTRGIARPDGLSSGQATTWLSTHASDILLKACLAEAEGFLKSDDRKPIWEEDYGQRLLNAKREIYTLLGQAYNLSPLEVPAQPTNAR